MVSSLNLAQLFVYSRDGHHLSSIPANDNDTLQDAMWTSFGNIIYTTTNSRKVVLISESGKFIAETLMTNPQYLSISSDNLIYLADSQTGIYESKNDGVSWKLFLKTAFRCLMLVKVATESNNDFWTLEQYINGNYYLGAYSVNRDLEDNSTNYVQWKSVKVYMANGKPINMRYCFLSSDRNMNIFLSDISHKAVHILSATCRQRYQTFSLPYFENKPFRLALSNEHKLLFVGQDNSTVGVYNLTYGKKAD